MTREIVADGKSSKYGLTYADLKALVAEAEQQGFKDESYVYYGNAKSGGLQYIQNLTVREDWSRVGD